jgi:Icc-related predicted phosphoesterase
MKITVWSDFHLEFQEHVPIFQNTGSDVLILSGDICVAEHLYRNPRSHVDVHGNVTDLSSVMSSDWHGNDARRFREFFQHVNDNWAHVIYVMGNHEHYEGRWDRTESVLREEMQRYPNIHFMEQDKLVIDDTVFLAASLWTDLNNQDPITVMSARDMMNDYRRVRDFTKGAYSKLMPSTTLAHHLSTKEWLRAQLGLDKRRTVVVTHHTPSFQSVHDSFKHDVIMNGAFANNMDDFIMDHEHIALWTHGHVHNCWDYDIGQTRIVCNPHGYPHENTGFDPAKTVDLP